MLEIPSINRCYGGGTQYKIKLLCPKSQINGGNIMENIIKYKGVSTKFAKITLTVYNNKRGVVLLSELFGLPLNVVLFERDYSNFQVEKLDISVAFDTDIHSVISVGFNQKLCRELIITQRHDDCVIISVSGTTHMTRIVKGDNVISVDHIEILDPVEFNESSGLVTCRSYMKEHHLYMYNQDGDIVQIIDED